MYSKLQHKGQLLPTCYVRFTRLHDSVRCGPEDPQRHDKLTRRSLEFFNVNQHHKIFASRALGSGLDSAGGQGGWVVRGPVPRPVFRVSLIFFVQKKSSSDAQPEASHCRCGPRSCQLGPRATIVLPEIGHRVSGVIPLKFLSPSGIGMRHTCRFAIWRQLWLH